MHLLLKKFTSTIDFIKIDSNVSLNNIKINEKNWYGFWVGHKAYMWLLKNQQ